MEEPHTTWSGLSWVKKAGFVWLGEGGESWLDGEGEAHLEQTDREHRSLSHPHMPPACLFLSQGGGCAGPRRGEVPHENLEGAPTTSLDIRDDQEESKRTQVSCPPALTPKASPGHPGKATAYPGTCPQLAMSRCFSSMRTDSCTGPLPSSCPAQRAVSAAHRLGDSSWGLL